MGLENTMQETEPSEESTNGEQRKSLIANSYSTSHDNNYKDVTGWGMDEDEINLAYLLNAPNSGGSASVQRALDGLFAGGHEEFYSRLQIALAHVFGRTRNIPEFEAQGIEAEGSVPVMQLLNIEVSDIVEYITETDSEVSAEDITAVLDSNPEVAQDVYDILSEVEGIEAEAD